LNSAQPTPQSANGKIIRISEASVLKDARKNCAATMTAQPIVQSRREPRRSDQAPAMGAMIMMITESATMIQPTCDGE